MEELHKVARAYYQNCSGDIRNLVNGFFYSIDTNHDNWISVAEAQQFLISEGYYNPNINIFLINELDRDRNGFLDFYEFLTLFYVIKTQNGFCFNCFGCLKGLYFTCVTCFDSPAARTYDLCSDCYGASNGNVHHHHRNFVDSALLLRIRRNNASTPQAVQQLMLPARNTADIEPYQNEQGRSGKQTAAWCLEIALAGAAIGVAAFCSIM